jgi:hypothetical protein
MEDAIKMAVEQVERADANAVAAMTAFALGPDSFRSYWEGQADVHQT